MKNAEDVITNEIVSLTGELMRFKSTHEQPEEIHKCMDYLEDCLKRADVGYRRIEKNGVPSLIALPNDGYAPILLMSHVDVVVGPDALFEPELRDGRLYGRGSLDDKYAAALSFVLLKNQLAKARAAGKNQNDLGVGILITGDEEVGGKNGARYALSELRTDFGVALDGGSIERIIVKEKGILTLRLITKGKTAHGSRPWLGENAIEKLTDDYARIKELFSGMEKNEWRRTLNFSIVRAGKSFNQVPDRAEAVFDIRYTENDDVDVLIEEIRGRTSGELVVEEREPLFFAGDTPYLDMLKSVTDQSDFGVEHGASDARFLSQYGTNGVVWGADGNDTQHCMDEHVEIASVGKLYHYLERFIEMAAGGEKR